jgi:hypothetical protein
LEESATVILLSNAMQDNDEHLHSCDKRMDVAHGLARNACAMEMCFQFHELGLQHLTNYSDSLTKLQGRMGERAWVLGLTFLSMDHLHSNGQHFQAFP